MAFYDNASPQWLEAQFRLWQEAPAQLSAEWRAFFDGYALGKETPAPATEAEPCLECGLKQSAVQSLIYRYRDIGHLLACTDPLSPCPLSHPLLDLAAFELTEQDLDLVFYIRRFSKESATLREILTTMQETYCRSVGVEFMYIQEPAERQWLIDRMEPVRNLHRFTVAEQLQILRKLQEATLFEEFLHRKFLGQKRFSLEGGEALIPLLDQAVNHAAGLGVEEIVLGMAHRGRLNVLANILGKPLAAIFGEFEESVDGLVGEGDVKYHKGFSADLVIADNRRLHLTLAFNPSHLEAVDPVVEGKCRARQGQRQGQRQGEAAKQVLPLLIHGDAAFAGQGMVAETLNLSQLAGYSTGGTLHVVVNNQIGFTTLPADARSTRYATDVAKMLMVPIFHVHGEDPEAVAHVARLALDYRQAFGRDVVVEVICYRRHGHNEGDEPYFTQPLMYDRIKTRPPAHRLYADRLRDQGVAADVMAEMIAEYGARLDEAVGQPPPPLAEGFTGAWQGVSREYQPVTAKTGVARGELLELAELLTRLPAGFAPHPKIVALLKRRLEAVQGGTGIDWGNGETLAYATLLREGVPVRLSGQDSRRGTFNHRHAVLHDLTSDAVHLPLAAVGSGRFQVYDSMLSENAVLGFEYGYSVATPEGLTLWEAQFGDFANGAQVIIDQFIAAGESKWDRACGLVLLLPHGYEGSGAEHSSARIERFLSLCAGNNLLVCNPSTPAQLFHLLRRQVKLPFRKPLVVMTPKSLLRHPRCVSSLAELSGGGFREVLADAGPPQQVQTVLFCSGKIYYELLEQREKSGRVEVAIVRLEQLYPLRVDLLQQAVAAYQGVKEWRWVQEEPANMGAWSFLRPLLAELLGREPGYVGRPAAAAPAVGSHRLHKVEQERVIAEAFAAS
jgi:2-oxoglutarate dehydrogenase E1 component